MTRQKYLTLVLLILLLVVLSACASPNPMIGVPLAETGEVYGFINGFWDGLTAFIAFLVNLFGGNFGIYEVHNNGGMYDLGFLIGIGIFVKAIFSKD